MKCDIWSLGFLFYEILYGQSPWIAQSIPQLVKNIYTQPLLFHDSINQVHMFLILFIFNNNKIQQLYYFYNNNIFYLTVSDDVKDFITRCLAIQENDRLSWQEVYLHPVFAYYFVQAPKVDNLFEEKELSIAMKLVDDTNKILNIENFSEIILALFENLEDDQIYYIFNCIDEDKNGKISCKHLLDWLNKYDISLEDTNIRSGSNTVYGVPEKKEIQQGLQQNVLNEDRQLIKILYDEIKTNNLNLVELFQKFATSSHTMSYQDFTNMMLQYDTNLSDWEIFETFKLFASNKCDNIKLNKFKQVQIV